MFWIISSFSFFFLATGYSNLCVPVLIDVACDMRNLPCRGTRAHGPPASTRSNMLNMQDRIVKQDICSITEDGRDIWYLSRAGEGKK